jgi:hypothetical protein
VCGENHQADSSASLSQLGFVSWESSRQGQYCGHTTDLSPTKKQKHKHSSFIMLPFLVER